jgi:thiol-disulfide isomerase/thioredoxin
MLLTEEIISDPTIEKLLEVLDVPDGELAAGAPTDEPAVHVVYLYKRGCEKCLRAEKLLGELKQAYPPLVVEPRNVKRHQALLEAMGQLYQIVDEKRLTTPAIFIGDECFLDGQVNKARLEAAIQQCLPTGAASRLAEAESHRTSAREHILTRFTSLSVFAVAGAGLLDGVNPCAFATLVLFISYLTLVGRKRKEIMFIGIAFTFAVFVTYLLLGMGALQFLDFVRSLPFLVRWAYLLIALLTFVLAVLSLHDAYLAKQGKVGDMKLQLPRSLKSHIHKVIRERTRTSGIVAGALGIGFAISALELVCTGQVYLPTLTFVAGVPGMRLHALAYVLLYNVMFIVPLLVVFGCVYCGVTFMQLGGILQRRLVSVKLVTGFLLLFLASWLALTVLT